MDFKALMSAQIAKAKPRSTAPTPTSGHNASGDGNGDTDGAGKGKYLRRADLERQREANYLKEQARLESERAERENRKRKLELEESERVALVQEKKRKLAEESQRRRQIEEREEETTRRKRLGLPLRTPDPDFQSQSPPHSEREQQEEREGGGQEEGGETGEDEEIEDAELRAKLRALKEPATLFEETHLQRLRRYHHLIDPQSDHESRPTTTTTKTTTTMTKSTTTKKPKLTNGPIPTTLVPVPEADMLLPNLTSSALLAWQSQSKSQSQPRSEPDRYTFLHRQLGSYFTLLLSEWSISLSLRSPATSSSSAGKQAYSIYRAVVSDLVPLFRKLEAQSLGAEMLTPLVEIVRNTQLRRYRDAVDGYLRLSIGRAAWPIGVTMVGIHERSAREKLHESGTGEGGKTAHIMSDEVTRKILQSVKRCVSYAQTRWPPEDVGQLMG